MASRQTEKASALPDANAAIRALGPTGLPLLSDEERATLHRVIVDYAAKGNANAAMWLLNKDEEGQKPKRGRDAAPDPPKVPRPATVFDQLEARRTRGRPKEG